MTNHEIAKKYLFGILTAGRDAIVAVSTYKEREALQTAEKALSEGSESLFKAAIKANLPPRALTIAQTAHPELADLTIENAGRLLRKEWSDHLAAAANSFEPTDKVKLDGVEVEYGLAREKYLETAKIMLEQAVTEARTTHEAAIQRIGKEIDTCVTELKAQWDDPNFEAALAVWGNSPDSKDDRNGGTGHHAGIVHYFEYRTTREKWRFNDSLAPLTLDGFIELSARIGTWITNPRHNELTHVGRWTDDAGQIRLNLRTQNGLFISSFQAVGDSQPRAITFIPGMDEKGPNKWSTKELIDPATDTRLNKLGAGRREFPLP